MRRIPPPLLAGLGLLAGGMPSIPGADIKEESKEEKATRLAATMTPRQIEQIEGTRRNLKDRETHNRIKAADPERAAIESMTNWQRTQWMKKTGRDGRKSGGDPARAAEFAALPHHKAWKKK